MNLLDVFGEKAARASAPPPAAGGDATIGVRGCQESFSKQCKQNFTKPLLMRHNISTSRNAESELYVWHHCGEETEESSERESGGEEEGERAIVVRRGGVG